MIFSTSIKLIDGCKYLPLYNVLDPNNPDDYIDRVEPSIQGGKKMAKAFYHLIDK